MTLLEAIDIRRSCRTYADAPLSQAHLEALSAKAAAINASEGLSIRVLRDASAAFRGLAKSYGMFKGVRSVIHLAGSTKNPDWKEKLGYHGEMLVLEATAMGLGTCWVAGSYGRKDEAFRCPDGVATACVIPVGLPGEGGRLADRAIHWMTHRKAMPPEAFYTAGADAPAWFFRGMEAVHKAPSAANLRPARFHWREGLVTAEAGNHPIDLGIAKAHFVLGAAEQGMHGRFAWGDGGAFVAVDS